MLPAVNWPINKHLSIPQIDGEKPIEFEKGLNAVLIDNTGL
jgi:hypothetical protein